jgi:glyoxylase-like metal-dependent hydrolase (beta-lactamase superfamily II)
MPSTGFICTTCGVQYPPSEVPPTSCIICNDDRQYIGINGQGWTTLERINQQYKNIIEQVAPRIYALYSTPSFAIGQRAHLIVSPSGNFLWDCITNLDDTTVELINALGGIKGIGISHPHYFSTITEWSDRFNAPLYISADDAEWLTRKNETIRYWKGREPLWDDLTLVQCGGHFPGASVLHIASGAGTLMVGDTIQVTPGQDRVSFMYSYPNMIPLKKTEIERIYRAVKDLEYDAMYGAFGKYIRTGAKHIMQQSVERYLQIYE